MNRRLFHRKVYRISLRSALALTLLISLVIGVLSKLQRSAMRQAELVHELRIAGATVTYDFGYTQYGDLDDPRIGYPLLNLNSLNQSTTAQPQPYLLARLFGRDIVHSIARVELWDSTLETNSELITRTMQLSKLQSLSVQNVPPNALDPIKEFQKLQRVVFWESANRAQLACVAKSNASEVVLRGEVDDSQLAMLGTSTKLRHLFANFKGNNTYTNAGLRWLTDRGNLKSLWLSSDSVTKDGLAHLKALTELTWLYLRLPNATETLGDVLRDKPITHLKIESMHLDQNSIESFSSMDRLRHLVLVDAIDSTRTPAFIASLSNLASLEFFSCEGVELSVTDIGYLLESGVQMIYGETSESSDTLRRAVDSHGGFLGRVVDGVAVEFFSSEE